MLAKENTVLLIIDVQGRLAQTMDNKQILFDNLQRIIRGTRVLGIPVLWVEQNPAGLGPTIPEVAGLLADNQPIAKYSFSCCGQKEFLARLQPLGRRQILVAGIEAHVCVYQTVRDLLALGYDVELVTDAVSSRTPENRRLGIERMHRAGAVPTSVEMALFELVKVAEGPQFKEIIQIVK
ncbi:MAG: hydrolase [Heliobacteriaceae bacterium]|nr:hydrolase [Heliobacteriaceae bacterium]MDD4586884.1 hydrolase [Heliobacteriaceae bacterium]